MCPMIYVVCLSKIGVFYGYLADIYNSSFLSNVLCLRSGAQWHDAGVYSRFT